jgi:hypothetical protein
MIISKSDEVNKVIQKFHQWIGNNWSFTSFNHIDGSGELWIINANNIPYVNDQELASKLNARMASS